MTKEEIASIGWNFDPGSGGLSVDSHRVEPINWGYCQIIKSRWTDERHLKMTFREAKIDPPPGDIAVQARSWLNALNRVITLRQRADTAEAAIREAAKIITGNELAGGRGTNHALNILIQSGQPWKSFAARIADQLLAAFRVCQNVLPDELKLPSNHIRGTKPEDRP